MYSLVCSCPFVQKLKDFTVYDDLRECIVVYRKDPKFTAYRSVQTVQTQIRLQERQSGQCLQFSQILGLLQPCIHLDVQKFRDHYNII